MVGLFGGEAKFPLPGVVFGCKQIKGVLVGSLDMMKSLIKMAESKSVSGQKQCGKALSSNFRLCKH